MPPTYDIPFFSLHKMKWDFLLFLIFNFYLIDCILVPTFPSYYSLTMTTLLPLNIIFLIIILLDLILKVCLTPRPLGSRRRKIFYYTQAMGLDTTVYILFLLSFVVGESSGRYLRLVIMYKVLFVVEYNDRIYQKLHTYSVIRQCYTIAKMVYIMILFGHYFGCMFYAIDNYLMATQAFGIPSENPQNYYMMESLCFTPIQALSDAQRYLYALYFTIALITTIAYGDIVGKNYVEDAFVLILLFLSTISVALILQQFMILMKKTQFALYEIIMEFNVMKIMMREKGVPMELQTHIRNYLFYTEYESTLTFHESVFNKLPKELQREVLYAGYSHYLRPYFPGVNVEELCTLVRVVSYQALNTIPQGLKEGLLYADLYILMEGEVSQYIECGTELVRHQHNSCFNKRAFYTHTLPEYTLKTNTMTKLITISHHHFNQYIKQYDQITYDMKRIKESTLVKEYCCQCMSNTHHDHCALCKESDHRVEACPDAHYVIDYHCKRAGKISQLLRRNVQERRYVSRKNKKSKKIKKILFFSLLFDTINRINNPAEHIRREYLNHLRDQLKNANHSQKHSKYVVDCTYDDRDNKE